MLFFKETWKVMLVQRTWPLMMMRGVTHNVNLGKVGTVCGYMERVR